MLAVALSGTGMGTATAGQAIIGGVVSDDAAVVMVRTPDGASCSGTVIAPRVVLSAAHCLAESLRNRLSGGEIGFGQGGISDVRAVESMIIHRRFDGRLPPGDFDIGLIRLAEPVPAYARPLPWVGRRLDRSIMTTVCRVVGFGSRTGLGSSSGVRRTVDLMVRAMDEQHLFMGDKERNSCHGDSGGPVLAVLEPGSDTEYIVGVNSYGPALCDGTSAKARVGIHADFIAEVVSMWDGPCALDGVCPGDTSACAFPDPDCDPCGLEGSCADDCPGVDLDCAVGGLSGDACVVASECESRVCDPEIGICVTACDLEGPDAPWCPQGFECTGRAGGTRVCRAEAGGCGCSMAAGAGAGSGALLFWGAVLLSLLIRRRA